MPPAAAHKKVADLRDSRRARDIYCYDTSIKILDCLFCVSARRVGRLRRQRGSCRRVASSTARVRQCAGQRVIQGAVRLASPVPGHEDALADGFEISGVRDDQHRAAGSHHDIVGPKPRRAVCPPLELAHDRHIDRFGELDQFGRVAVGDDVPLALDAGHPQLVLEAALDAVGDLGFVKDFGARSARARRFGETGHARHTAEAARAAPCVPVRRCGRQSEPHQRCGPRRGRRSGCGRRSVRFRREHGRSL